jgi:glycerol-3-phosphate dehydrogenase
MNPRFDVVVIGGGIHGVGVAQAAAAAGQSTLVLERTALAAGTSSRSSKLIHGGLRYLETMQFRLVRESLHEREILLRVAPELVRRIPFFIPVYGHTTRPPWMIRAGLSLYALLGGLNGHARFITVPRAQWDSLDGIDTRDLRAVFRYYDAQTDDTALTHAVMCSAESLGARLECPAEFLGAERRADGYAVRYRAADGERECHASTLVNAAGPWVNLVLDRISPKPDARAVELVQGTHILLDGQTGSGIFYVEAPHDRRAVFVMPWHHATLVGTTETPYRGDPAAVHPLTAEVDYLVETFRRYFPQRDAAVHSSFAGLRVLPAGGGSAFRRPRETVFHPDDRAHPRLISVYGGKLTGYRAAALQILQQLANALPARKPRADTATLALTNRGN